MRESPSVECVPRKDSEFLMWQVRESLAAGAEQLITFSSPSDRTRNSRASISFFVSKQKSQAKKNDVLSLAASLDPGVDRVLPLASRDVVRRAGRERTAAVSFPRRHQATRIATENSLSTSTPLHPLSLSPSLSPSLLRHRYQVKKCERPHHDVLRTLESNKTRSWYDRAPAAEVRRSAPLVVAEVEVPRKGPASASGTVEDAMRDALSRGFRQIASYIFGRNDAAVGASPESETDPRFLDGSAMGGGSGAKVRMRVSREFFFLV